MRMIILGSIQIKIIDVLHCMVTWLCEIFKGDYPQSSCFLTSKHKTGIVTPKILEFKKFETKVSEIVYILLVMAILLATYFG